MRCLILRLLLVVVALAPLAGAADLFDGLQFADGKDRSSESFANQVTLVVFFSGQCPNAAKWMGTQVKSVHDWFESDHVNASLVLVTPDVASDGLLALDDSRGYHMVHALYASDPQNRLNVSLQNIIQVRMVSASGRIANNIGYVSDLLSVVKSRLAALGMPGSDTGAGAAGAPLQPPGMGQDGSGQTGMGATQGGGPPASDTSTTSSEYGSYRISRAGLTEPEVIDLWWEAERSRPEAIKHLQSAVARSRPGSQVRLLSEHVNTFFSAREQDLCAAPATMATLEGLEALLTDGEGLPLKLANKRYRELTHLKSLHDELRARDGFEQCQKLLHSPRQSDQGDAKEGLSEIAQGYPATVYGQKAAGLLQDAQGHPGTTN